MQKFVDCRTKDASRRELYIVEGDSAMGAVKQSRDSEYQAIMPIRGKILNCLKADYARIFKSDVIVDLVKVMGCGVELGGKHNKELATFNIDNLRYNKIVICTDADVDGYQIRTLVLTMLYRLTPTLINEGYVYIAESPLYEITTKDHTYFAYTEPEKAAFLKEIGDKKYTIQRSKGLGENDPEMMWLTTMNPESRRLIKVLPTDVEETARGARIVKTEYERMIASGEHKLIISSCCHSVNLLIQKRYPQALPYLAKVDSPMLAHAKSIKERVPGSAVVFIGPCISKKDEAEQYGQVDCVLTFDELIDWLAEEGIELPAGEQPDGTEARSRFFPTAGGIIRSMDLDDGFSYIPIDGLRRCMDALEEIERGGMQNCFVEMNACEGSCIGGPVMHRYHSAPITCKTRVEQYSGKSGRDFDDQPADDLCKSMQYIGSGAVKPGEAAIQEVLHKLGKYRPEDELNCGTCGYSTCREKARSEERRVGKECRSRWSPYH